jgi:hypothetical protein
MKRHLRGAVRKGPLIGFGLGLLILAFIASRTCLSTGFAHGLWIDECPDGELRQIAALDSGSLTRGAEGSLTVQAFAAFTVGPADTQETEPLSRFTPTVSLVGPGVDQVLEPKDGWKQQGASRVGTVTIPTVKDGDYVLRAKVNSSIGETVVDAPLPLYAPARIHLLTDRPLYEPGNTVQFRALVLHAGTLSPLDGRPGVFRVTDPNGEVLLEEKAAAGDWGVVRGSFPLDSQAESGTWTVSWSSGPASESRAFTVKPFTLPRFRVEASTSKPFYRRNERPVLRGEVKYASGAPVANAKVELSWSTSGAWPPPTSWVDGSALPKHAETDKAGTFEVELPAVPDDLQGEAHLSAALSAVDPSGDRVEGSADVMLSEDAIAVSAVPELRDGLVEGFNNRLYLRATTADGMVLSNADLLVKRLWEPTDKGVVATSDEDGVASLQLDPGPAVNVVIPALPFRPPPKADPVTRSELTDRLGDDEVSLADRLTFDRAEGALTGCTRYVGEEGGAVSFGLHVRASGAIAGLARVGEQSRLSGCVEKVLSGLKFAAAGERLFSVAFSFNDEDLPRLSHSAEGVPNVPVLVDDALADAMLEVRDCLPSTVQSGPMQRQAFWKFEPGAKELSLTWVPEKNGGRISEAAIGCVTSRLGRLTLPRPKAPGDEGEQEFPAVGVVSFDVSAPEKYEAERPQETIMEGYEFLVTAKKGGETLGSTKLRLRPGVIPDLRLRASSQLVDPGEAVTVQLLRGPNWSGTLPEKLWLRQGARTWESKFDEKEKSATWTMPTDVEGWFSVQFESAEVFLYSRPRALLSVKVKPEKDRYAPGQLAHLEIDTTIGGVGGAAAVGLFGVDDSLSQLAPLPGAGELDGLRPRVASEMAFPGIDAHALAQGRVRGKNAQAATLLKVSQLPPPPEHDTPVAASARTSIDPNEALVDRFYVALAELHVQTREWEASAPAAEKMTPRTMATLWKRSLDAMEKRNESSRDFWGRRLRLHRLPMDLLALTEPRQVVIDGTRLPEDSENWNLWVAKEKP